jgi:hypothetical protein
MAISNTGLGGLGLLGWRRKRKAQGSNLCDNSGSLAIFAAMRRAVA